MPGRRGADCGVKEGRKLLQGTDRASKRGTKKWLRGGQKRAGGLRGWKADAVIKEEPLDLNF